MGQIIASLFSDGINNSVSSKRVITFAAFCLCSLSFVCELFLNKKVTPETFDAMMYIVIAGLGFTASEKFVSKRTEK